jgi:hypothetical protein
MFISLSSPKKPLLYGVVSPVVSPTGEDLRVSHVYLVEAMVSTKGFSGSPFASLVELVLEKSVYLWYSTGIELGAHISSVLLAYRKRGRVRA